MSVPKNKELENLLDKFNIKKSLFYVQRFRECQVLIFIIILNIIK